MSSFLTPLALPQADMTHASLYPSTPTTSTPFAFSLERFSMYPGKSDSVLARQPEPGWKLVHTRLAVQVGVKAPGTAKRTTFLFLNSLLAS